MIFNRQINTHSLICDHFTVYTSRNEVSIHILELDQDGSINLGKDIDRVKFSDLNISSIGELTEDIINSYIQKLDTDLAVSVDSPDKSEARAINLSKQSNPTEDAILSQ